MSDSQRYLEVLCQIKNAFCINPLFFYISAFESIWRKLPELNTFQSRKTTISSTLLIRESHLTWNYYMSKTNLTVAVILSLKEAEGGRSISTWNINNLILIIIKWIWNAYRRAGSNLNHRFKSFLNICLYLFAYICYLFAFCLNFKSVVQIWTGSR